MGQVEVGGVHLWQLMALTFRTDDRMASGLLDLTHSSQLVRFCNLLSQVDLFRCIVSHNHQSQFPAYACVVLVILCSIHLEFLYLFMSLEMKTAIFSFSPGYSGVNPWFLIGIWVDTWFYAESDIVHHWVRTLESQSNQSNLEIWICACVSSTVLL